MALLLEKLHKSLYHRAKAPVHHLQCSLGISWERNNDWHIIGVHIQYPILIQTSWTIKRACNIIEAYTASWITELPIICSPASCLKEIPPLGTIFCLVLDMGFPHWQCCNHPPPMPAYTLCSEQRVYIQIREKVLHYVRDSCIRWKRTYIIDLEYFLIKVVINYMLHFYKCLEVYKLQKHPYP